VVYDRYTSSFTFGRLNQAAELLEKLQNIESKQPMSPKIEILYSKLYKQSDEAISEHPWSLTVKSTAPKLYFSTEDLYKFIAGGAPWFLLSLVAIPGIFRREKDQLSGFLGVQVFGIFFGAIGVLIPTIFWPWVNLIIYPLFHPLLLTLVLVILTMLIQKRAEKKSEPKVIP
jgi:hypothetical protein